MCTVLLPSGDNPIAVNKYIISHFVHRHIADKFCPLFLRFVNKMPVYKTVYSTRTVTLHNWNKHTVYQSTGYLYCTLRENWCRPVRTPAVVFRSVNRTLALIHAYMMAETKKLLIPVYFPDMLIRPWLRYTHTHTHTRTHFRRLTAEKMTQFSISIQFKELHRGFGKDIARNKWGDEPGVAHSYPKFCVLILNITGPKQDYLGPFCDPGHLTQTYPTLHTVRI